MAQKPKIVVWDDTIKYRELPTEFLVSEIRDYSDAKNEFFVSCNEVPKTDLGLSKNKNEIENMKAAFQYGKKNYIYSRNGSDCTSHVWNSRRI